MRPYLWLVWLLGVACLVTAAAISVEVGEVPCRLLGCEQCHPDGAGCFTCLDESWALKDGMCACAMGAGTHVRSAEALEGWPTVAPAPETRRMWNDDQHAVMTRWRKLGGRSPNQGGLASSACSCRPCPAGWTSLGGLPVEAMCYPSSDGTRRLYPIPTPAPPPIKTPYKGFYKDLASISNYIGSITVSWGKAIDQSNKVAFDLTRSAMLFKYSSVNSFFDIFIGKDDLGKLVDKGIALNFRQIGDDGTLNRLKSRQLAWEGKLIKNVMSFTSALSIIFSIVDIASSMTTKDPTQAKLDFLVETTDHINQTVTETLARVKFVQDKIDRIDEILRTISQQLELILTEIQNTRCYTSNSNVDAVWTQSLKPLWYRYTIGTDGRVKGREAEACMFKVWIWLSFA